MQTPVTAENPNFDEISFWNGPQGKNWVKRNALTDLMYDPFGARAVAAADLKRGEAVLDIGCGCGTTTRALAVAVGSTGHVTSLDPSIPMLEVARQRLAEFGDTVDFICDDAATHPFTPMSYDVLFSQFGLMFFIDTLAAFENMATALRSGGRLSFVCWRSPEFNPWLTVLYDAASPYAPEMRLPKPGTATTPFSLALEPTVKSVLEKSGFTEIALHQFDETNRMGQGSLDDCIEFITEFSNPVATALRLNPPTMAPEILGEIKKAVAPYYDGQTIALPASSWIVTARKT
ncbi:MAG: class I SAM-dependent methyltransferase [Marivivens sp.]|nr:class I SAM-dependent methyltransferase [Marivivens sp.]